MPPRPIHPCAAVHPRMDMLDISAMEETDTYRVRVVDQMPLRLQLWSSAVAVAADSLHHLGTYTSAALQMLVQHSIRGSHIETFTSNMLLAPCSLLTR